MTRSPVQPQAAKAVCDFRRAAWRNDTRVVLGIVDSHDKAARRKRNPWEHPVLDRVVCNVVVPIIALDVLDLAPDDRLSSRLMSALIHGHDVVTSSWRKCFAPRPAWDSASASH